MSAHHMEHGPRNSSAPRRKGGALRSIRGTHCSSRTNSRFNSQTANFGYAFAFPRRHAPEVLQRTFRPGKSEGVGNAGCPLHPWPRVQKVESTRVLTADTPVHPAFPHAMVLTVSFALSPVTGLDCHRRRRNKAPLKARLGKGAFRRLDASVGASGPHDFAVRKPHHSSARRLIAHRPCGLPCHHVLAPDEPASTASRPASVTIASRPSVGRDGMG
jgi:hypothetical protein